MYVERERSLNVEPDGKRIRRIPIRSESQPTNLKPREETVPSCLSPKVSKEKYKIATRRIATHI